MSQLAQAVYTGHRKFRIDASEQDVAVRKAYFLGIKSTVTGGSIYFDGLHSLTIQQTQFWDCYGSQNNGVVLSKPSEASNGFSILKETCFDHCTGKEHIATYGHHSATKCTVNQVSVSHVSKFQNTRVSFGHAGFGSERYLNMTESSLRWCSAGASGGSFDVKFGMYTQLTDEEQFALLLGAAGDYKGTGTYKLEKLNYIKQTIPKGTIITIAERNAEFKSCVFIDCDSRCPLFVTTSNCYSISFESIETNSGNVGTANTNIVFNAAPTAITLEFRQLCYLSYGHDPKNKFTKRILFLPYALVC